MTDKTMLSINTKGKYAGHTFYTDKPYVAAGAEPLPINTYDFYDAANRLHINKDGTTRSDISIPLTNLQKGDKITVEFECLIMSPANTDGIIRIAFNEIAGILPASPVTLVDWYDVPHSNNKWQKVKIDYMFPCTTYNNYIVDIGVPSGLSGNVFMVNIKVEVQKQNVSAKEVTKSFVVTKAASVWGLKAGYHTSGATVTAIDASSIEIVFKKPFTSIPSLVTIPAGDSFSRKYRLLPTISALGSVRFQVFDKTDTGVALALVENAVQFNVLMQGFE